MSQSATRATISAGQPGLTEIELVRPNTEGATGEVLAAVERGAALLAGEPGFAAASVHVSDDATVVSCTQWSDDAAREAARAHLGDGLDAQRAPHVKERDAASYEVVFVQARDGDEIRIEPGAEFATLIDVLMTEPEQQEETVRFNVANGQAFATQPGFRATSVLRGLDGTRNVTYSQWDRVEDWIAAVKKTAGERVPALRTVESVEQVNAVLQEVGRQMGNVPEYHAYRVTSVIGPASSPARA